MATTHPLKSRTELEAVRSVLTNTRDRCLFTLGVNTAFRRGDLLTLNVGQVRYLKAGDTLVIKEQKTDKIRSVSLNGACIQALQALVVERLGAGAVDGSPLFVSQKQGNRLTIVSLSRAWKHWCDLAGLKGCFASHSARKTFGYLNRVERKVPIEVLQKAYGHSSSAVTLTYICIQDEELKDLYEGEF